LPGLGNFAIHEAGGAGSRERHFFAGRLYTPPLTLVGTAIRPARNYLIPFSDHVVNRELAWQRGEEASEILFEVLSALHTTCLRWAARIMEDKVSGVELVYDSNARLIETNKHTASNGLIVFS